MVRVQIDGAALAARQLSTTQLVAALQHANRQAHLGSIPSSNREILLETGTFLRDAQDVSTLVVGVFEGRPVFLRDVAHIIDGPEEPANYVLFGTGARNRAVAGLAEAGPGSPTPATTGCDHA